MPNPKEQKNIFFDFSKLPPEKGILLFPLSISLLRNRQNADNLIKDLYNFYPTKMSKPLIGVNYLYSDFLYLYSNKPAPELKQSFMSQVVKHKNEILNIVRKNQVDFQIQHAFSFTSWNQMYLGTTDFEIAFDKIKKIYKEDLLFQKYVSEDCVSYGKDMEDNQVLFFLEEALMFYMIQKNQVKLPNEYIENHQKWVLLCYPGKPLKTIIYLAQINPFNISWDENSYSNSFYDLENKQLVEYDRVDLETYLVK
ncbi:MAG: hypothetical protein WCQ32_00425 [bacterium]